MRCRSQTYIRQLLEGGVQLLELRLVCILFLGTLVLGSLALRDELSHDLGRGGEK